MEVNSACPFAFPMPGCVLCKKNLKVENLDRLFASGIVGFCIGSANRRDNGGRTRRGPGGSVRTVFVEIDGIGDANIVTESKSGCLQKRGKMSVLQ